MAAFDESEEEFLADEFRTCRAPAPEERAADKDLELSTSFFGDVAARRPLMGKFSDSEDELECLADPNSAPD